MTRVLRLIAVLSYALLAAACAGGSARSSGAHASSPQREWTAQVERTDPPDYRRSHTSVKAEGVESDGDGSDDGTEEPEEPGESGEDSSEQKESAPAHDPTSMMLPD